jgi:Skp family chaperone for outer membrane proteins
MRIALLTLVTLVALTATARADERVGYVNVARILAESEAGKQGSADLEQYRLQLVKAESEADAEAAKAPAATAKAKRDAAASLKAQRQQLLEQRNGMLIKALRDRIAKVAAKLGPERKLDVVFEGTPLYARYDLTAEVISRLNAEAAPVAAADSKAKDAEIAALKAELKKRPPAKAAAKPEPTAALPNLDPRALTATRPNP